MQEKLEVKRSRRFDAKRLLEISQSQRRRWGQQVLARPGLAQRGYDGIDRGEDEEETKKPCSH
jgi:hypothetical protein